MADNTHRPYPWRQVTPPDRVVVVLQTTEVFCPECGARDHARGAFCVFCGAGFGSVYVDAERFRGGEPKYCKICGWPLWMKRLREGEWESVSGYEGKHFECPTVVDPAEWHLVDPETRDPMPTTLSTPGWRNEVP